MNEELVKCVLCQEFVYYEDALVYEHRVEDEMLSEVCICKWCDKERRR